MEEGELFESGSGDDHLRVGYENDNDDMVIDDDEVYDAYEETCKI